MTLFCLWNNSSCSISVRVLCLPWFTASEVPDVPWTCLSCSEWSRLTVQLPHFPWALVKVVHCSLKCNSMPSVRLLSSPGNVLFRVSNEEIWPQKDIGQAKWISSWLWRKHFLLLSCLDSVKDTRAKSRWKIWVPRLQWGGTTQSG